ncbi:MAG TPA: DNA adenine methylase [Phycisphaerae bacterium]|nr:DNA adenine methylase [Phycisphaerae bacterium]
MTDSAIQPRITAIAPWFGGKRGLAGTVVEELGVHSAYWEPFCGSCAILFAKPPSSHETVIDLHGDLTNLAMVIASDQCGRLVEGLRHTLCCENLFRTAKQFLEADDTCPPASPQLVGPSHVARAYWYFVIAWVGRNGVAGTRRVNYQMAVRWTPGGGHGGQRFASAVDSLPWWHRRLRRVLILNRDAFEVIPRIEDVPGVAVYCDPPYFMDTRGTGRQRGPSGGGSNYLHDFAEADHARLATELARFSRARVVVSYYDSPALAELYPPGGWTKRAVYRPKNLHVQNRRGSSKCTAPEVLLLNGPSYAMGDDLFGTGGQ